jgi:hypothetical protein
VQHERTSRVHKPYQRRALSTREHTAPVKLQQRVSVCAMHITCDIQATPALQAAPSNQTPNNLIMASAGRFGPSFHALSTAQLMLAMNMAAQQRTVGESLQTTTIL